MATFTATFVEEGVWQSDWTGLLTAQNGSPDQLAKWPFKCFQVTGAIGVGGTITLQGSNNASDWFTLHNTQGVALIGLTPVSTEVKDIAENPRHVRPSVVGGDGGTNLAVRIISR